MAMQSVAVSCSSSKLWKRVTFLKTPTVQQLWHLQSVGLASRLVQNFLARVYCSQIQHLWEATEHSPWEQRLQQITYWHDSLYWQFWVSVAFSRVATLPDQMWHLKTFISPRVVPLFQLHVPCATSLGSYLRISQVHPSSRAPGRSSNLSPMGSVQSSQKPQRTRNWEAWLSASRSHQPMHTKWVNSPPWDHLFQDGLSSLGSTAMLKLSLFEDVDASQWAVL